MVTDAGLEGGAIYAALPALRDKSSVMLDLRPDKTEEALIRRLAQARGKDSVANILRKSLSLPPVAIGLMREATGNRLPERHEDLARLIKSVPLPIAGIRPLDRAISTAGGVAFDELDEHLMLRDHPGVFVAGEMLDWEAPTGGYLLQACFATARRAADGANAFTRSQG
jgi:predicted flavoprotein YhiN